MLSCRGGVRQRLKRALEKDTHDINHLETRLLELWGWGSVSAPVVQSIAEAAALDLESTWQTVPQSIEGLAKIGTQGSWPGNCHRDLVQRFAPKIRLPEPVMLDLPMVSARQGAEGDVFPMAWPVMAPHHLWECLHKHFPTEVDAILGKGAQHFWQQLGPMDPRRANNPAAGKHAGPLLVHGDKGTFTDNGNSLVVISWSCALSSGDTWDRLFLITAVPKRCCCTSSKHGVDTLQVLWEYLVLFFNSMFCLKHPPADIKGKPWPTGTYCETVAGQDLDATCAAIFMLLGDWEWFSLDLGLPHFNSNDFCWRCRCNRSTLAFTNLSMAAAEGDCVQ